MTEARGCINELESGVSPEEGRVVRLVVVLRGVRPELGSMEEVRGVRPVPVRGVRPVWPAPVIGVSPVWPSIMLSRPKLNIPRPTEGVEMGTPVAAVTVVRPLKEPAIAREVGREEGPADIELIGAEKWWAWDEVITLGKSMSTFSSLTVMRGRLWAALTGGAGVHAAERLRPPVAW